MTARTDNQDRGGATTARSGRRRRPVARLGVLLALAMSAAPLLPIAQSGAAPEIAARAPAPVKPCGKGKATGSTDIGVSNDTITIATIQDIGGPRPGLFEAPQKAVDAFVQYCNSLGGINGRKLELIKYDSELLQSYPQYVKACDEAFAIVGEAVIFDDAGVKPTTECGIPSLPTTSTAPRQTSDNVINPLPNPPGEFAAARYEWLKRTYPDAPKHAAILYPSTSTTRNSGEKQKAGLTKLGWKFGYTGVTEINVVNWGPFVDQIRQNDTTYMYMVADFVNWAGIQREMQAQGVKVEVMDGISSLYTPEYLDQAGPAAEGTLIPLQTAPFEEAKQIPELATFLKWMKKLGGKPTSLAVTSWSAGLLFATAAQSLGSDVTRDGLLAALKDIHQWNGNGIQATADPGAKASSGCFLYLQVKNEKFVRLYPKKKATFACGSKIITVPESF